MKTKIISGETLTAATEALHSAMDALQGGHGRDGDWVEAKGQQIAFALLVAGWTPPVDTE